jgi:hypothetical protein
VPRDSWIAASPEAVRKDGRVSTPYGILAMTIPSMRSLLSLRAPDLDQRFFGKGVSRG